MTKRGNGNEERVNEHAVPPELFFLIYFLPGTYVAWQEHFLPSAVNQAIPDLPGGCPEGTPGRSKTRRKNLIPASHGFFAPAFKPGNKKATNNPALAVNCLPEIIY